QGDQLLPAEQLRVGGEQRALDQADRHGDAVVQAVAELEVVFGDAAAQALPDLPEVAARQRAQHQQELLAAPARHVVAAALEFVQQLPELLQHAVAGGVAVGVV